MGDETPLFIEFAAGPLASAILERLEQAWPDSITLDAPAVTGGTERIGMSRFRREVQQMLDQGLLQYELCTVSSGRPTYHFAAITQNGRELLRRRREEEQLLVMPPPEAG